MKWSVAYATGIPTIDQQHQMLFQTSEDYRAALDLGEGERVYGLVLEFLESFAQAHFGHEEGCMARCGCAVAGQNAAAHRRFIDRLKDFKHRYTATGFSPQDATQLVDFLDQWLASHIARIDIRLKGCPAEE